MYARKTMRAKIIPLTGLHFLPPPLKVDLYHLGYTTSDNYTGGVASYHVYFGRGRNGQGGQLFSVDYPVQTFTVPYPMLCMRFRELKRSKR